MIGIRLTRLNRPPLPRALLAALVIAPTLAGTALAQSNQDMGSMKGMPGTSGAVASAPAAASAVGIVEAVNTKLHKITINHEAIAALNWPSMKMEFKAAPFVDLAKAKVGSKVHFMIRKGAEGSYMVETLEAR